MALKPISDEEIRSTQIQGNLPNRPTQSSLYPDNTITAEEVKEAFDKLPKLVANRLNELIRTIISTTDGRLNADSLAGMMQTGLREGHTLYDLLLEIANGTRSFLPAISQADNDKVPTAENGKWILKAGVGQKGKSAYEIALEHGFKGSEEAWLNSLKADSEILKNVTSADNGKVLGVENGSAKWIGIDKDLLPQVSQNDNGKYLLVQNGEWVAEHFSISSDYMLEGTSGALINNDEIVGHIVRGETPLKLIAKSGQIVSLFPVSKTGSWDTYYFIGTALSQDATTLTVYIVTLLDANRSWQLATYPFPLDVKQALDQNETELSDHREHLEKLDQDITLLNSNNEELYDLIEKFASQTPTTGTTSKEYVRITGGSEGHFDEAALTVLSNRENGIEYVIEESVNSSRIYYCHLSENTKTKKTYVSSAYVNENGSASYILIHVESSGDWYKTERTYKGFPTPTVADSGKVLTVFSNGTPLWLTPSFSITEEDKTAIANEVLSMISNGNGVAY